MTEPSQEKETSMKLNLRLAMTIAALVAVPAVFGQTTENTVLSVSFGPEAQFTAADAGTTLSKGGTQFQSFTGTTNFTYKIRTTVGSGGGSITVALTTFGSGGPALTDLSYTCTAQSGTPCATPTTATTGATNVVAFGADAHSADTGDTGTTAWTLVDRTTIKTGTYTSTATYTISAT
jgi:hypothetical protein